MYGHSQRRPQAVLAPRHRGTLVRMQDAAPPRPAPRPPRHASAHLQVPAHGAREHEALQVLALAHHVGGAVAVRDARDVLLDDGAWGAVGEERGRGMGAGANEGRVKERADAKGSGAAARGPGQGSAEGGGAEPACAPRRLPASARRPGRTRIELAGRVVRGRADDLDAPLVRAVVGSAALKRWQKAVVDVDRAPPVAAAEVLAEYLGQGEGGRGGGSRMQLAGARCSCQPGRR